MCPVKCGMKLLIHSQTSTVVEVWEWIRNFIPHFIGDVITYPCNDWSWTMLVKGVPDVLLGCVYQTNFLCSIILLIFTPWPQMPEEYWRHLLLSVNLSVHISLLVHATTQILLKLGWNALWVKWDKFDHGYHSWLNLSIMALKVI